MSHRQRVLMALNHQKPDRIPIDLGGFQTGIHRIAYAELLKYLRVKDQITLLDPIQQLAQPCEKVLERFHVDTRYVMAQAPKHFRGGIAKSRRNNREWHDFTDEFGVIWSMAHDQQLYMDISHHPLANASLREVIDYPFPEGGDESRFLGLRERALTLQEKMYAVCTGIGGVVYEYCWYLRGLEQWLIDTLEQPEICAALLDKMLKFWMDYYSAYMREIGDVVDVVMVGDDLTGQNGPLFSPSFYRALVKPRQKALVQHIKSLTPAKIWYHTCGSCISLIPELIDNGIDILNPVQTSAQNMNPLRLKQEFGHKLVFWGGGCDSQHILPFATPEQVKADVIKNISIFKVQGGYIFNNIHNIQAGVPPENIIAMFDAAYEAGFYA
jgi:uroporphyrinogen decarboxylase